jgi:hypothetical protein
MFTFHVSYRDQYCISIVRCTFISQLSSFNVKHDLWKITTGSEM